MTSSWSSPECSPACHAGDRGFKSRRGRLTTLRPNGKATGCNPVRSGFDSRRRLWAAGSTAAKTYRGKRWMPPCPAAHFAPAAAGRRGVFRPWVRHGRRPTWKLSGLSTRFGTWVSRVRLPSTAPPSAENRLRLARGRRGLVVSAPDEAGPIEAGGSWVDGLRIRGPAHPAGIGPFGRRQHASRAMQCADTARRGLRRAAADATPAGFAPRRGRGRSRPLPEGRAGSSITPHADVGAANLPPPNGVSKQPVGHVSGARL